MTTETGSYDAKEAEELGRMILGWSGIKPGDQGVKRFLNAVPHSSIPEAAGEVGFSVKNDPNHDNPSHDDTCDRCGNKVPIFLQSDQVTFLCDTCSEKDARDEARDTGGVQTMTKTKAKAEAKTTVIKLVGERSFTSRGQDQDLRSRWEIGPFKVRVSVHLDTSYDFQSRVYAEVWRDADTSWQNVATLHYGEVKSRAHYTSSDKPDEAALIGAETELLERAAWALGVQ